jgi:transcriptional regulator with XRE-family HTH domain
MLTEIETPAQRVRTPYQGGFVPLGIRPEKPTVALVENPKRPLEFRPEIQQLTLGRQLFLLRKQFAISMGMKKFSQRQLASKAGVDHSVISKLENGRIQDPRISVVASLVEALALEPDSPQKLLLIASLAKDRDKAYVNGLLGLSGSHSDLWRPYVLNTGISEAVKPADKVKDYAERRNKRSQRGIAERGGIDHSFVSRFLSGEVTDISGSSFVAIARGLDLTKKQLLDLFDAFGSQRKNSAVMETLEQKAS